MQRTPPWVIPRGDRAVALGRRETYARQPWLQRLVRSVLSARLEWRAIAFVRAPGLASIEPRRQAQKRYNHALQQRLVKTVWSQGGCRSWYLSADGHNRTLWPDFSFRFRRQLSNVDWREFELQPITS